MKQFLVTIGWKDPYGDWIKEEIILDLTIITVLVLVVGGVYAGIKYYA